jgi:hypothetical protein
MKLNKLFRKGDVDGCACVFIFALLVLMGVGLYYMDSAKSRERHYIEGTIGSVSNPWAPGPAYNNRVQVNFVDGRFMIFAGVSPKPLEQGKYYKITYDGNNKLIDIEEIPK